MEVIALNTCRGCTVSLVIEDELAWKAFTFPRSCSVKKTFMHILAVECVMQVPPSGFVVAQVVLMRCTTSLPVASNVLLKDNGFHHRNVNFPLPEPLGALNEEIRARQRLGLLTGTGPTVGSTSKEGTNFNIEVSTFKDLDYGAKKTVRHAVNGSV